MSRSEDERFVKKISPGRCIKRPGAPFIFTSQGTTVSHNSGDVSIRSQRGSERVRQKEQRVIEETERR